MSTYAEVWEGCPSCDRRPLEVRRDDGEAPAVVVSCPFCGWTEAASPELVEGEWTYFVEHLEPPLRPFRGTLYRLLSTLSWIAGFVFGSLEIAGYNSRTERRKRR